MLKLYYGREHLDKNRFLFAQIEQTLEQFRQKPEEQKGILLVVPDQFTLQAEREAFSYMQVEGLMDLDILSQSRLGYRILSETGGGARLHIDKYGRHMLLTKIISEMNQELQAFLTVKKSHAFVELTNDLITEMKQYNITPELLPDKIESLPGDSLLVKKLRDLQKIYALYEQCMQGKYMDNEDYMNLVTSKVQASTKIAHSEIWITGFLSFTPNTRKLLEQLICHSLNVHVVMTADERKGRDRDLFDLPRMMMQRLSFLAEQNNVSWTQEEIGSEWGRAPKQAALLHLERELYAYPQKPSSQQEGIAFCQAANYYNEAETAATEIVSLVREQGFRYQDIGVICNDMEERGSIIKRVFAEYEIPVFLDCKRTVLHNPAVELILSLLDVVEGGWLFDDVFRLIKTGLVSSVSRQDWEELENYSLQYKIRGNSWKRPFQYGKSTLDEGRLERLEQLRIALTEQVLPFEEEWRSSKCVKDRTAALYEFLQKKLELPKQLHELQESLLQRKELEAAEEIGQTWAVVIGLLDQMVELLGEEELPVREYGQLLRSGFEAIEIGLLPPSEDLILVGTMQRTRTGKQRALLVLGANDGVLPAATKDKALLNDDEKAYLFARDIAICKDDTLREQEEKLAIYQVLCTPEEYLYLSYSVTDLDGKECKPSLIYDKLRKLFPDVSQQKDIGNRGSLRDLMQTKTSTMNHLTEVLEQVAAGTAKSEQLHRWETVYNWILRGEVPAVSRAELNTLRTGLLYDNKMRKLEKQLTERLYGAENGADLILSPSRLEKFGRCPFAHFVQYGLRPAERRVFEIAGREVGDAYHECLMRLSQELTAEGVAITAPESQWMQLTEEMCHQKVQRLMAEVAKEYREGIMEKGEEERYRAERMVQVCEKAAWALVSHVQAGTIEQIYFEAEFGKDAAKPFPPVTVDVGGQRVRIEGKIDRVDVLPAEENTSYIKIIDYKSGREKFDMEEARSGWRLQLMLYLEAAMGGLVETGKQAKPAGVFYFEIAEPMTEERAIPALAVAESAEPAEAGAGSEDFAAKLSNKLMRSFKMDGILLDEPLVINSLDHDFEGHSAIIPVQRKKDGTVAGSSENKLLSEDDFSEFRMQVDGTIKELCKELAQGSAAIEPRKSKDGNACQYCTFKGICQFDTLFDGCRYR